MLHDRYRHSIMVLHFPPMDISQGNILFQEPVSTLLFINFVSSHLPQGDQPLWQFPVPLAMLPLCPGLWCPLTVPRAHSQASVAVGPPSGDGWLM